MSGIKCYCCGDKYHYTSEMMFLLGNTAVHVDEQYPDWDKAICHYCYDFDFVVANGTGLVFWAYLMDTGKWHITGNGADCFYKFDEVIKFIHDGVWRLL